MMGLTVLRRSPVICGVVRPAPHFPPPISFISETKMRRAASVDTRHDGVGSDSNLDAAIRSASLRFEETLRPDPLFIDPYAECLVFPDDGNFGIKKQHPASQSSTLYYRLATKFIDDKILNEVNSHDELRQIVLLTDGMDTRPYRLNWPRYTVIYDISPEAIFKEAHKKLRDSGAKVSKTCMMVHTSMELSELQMLLPRKGFSGYKSSLWALQGMPLATLAEFENILSTVSSLAMKGCSFIGEFPGQLLGDKSEDKLATQKWMEKLFSRHGFRASVVNYDEVATNVHDVANGDSADLLFVARQLRFSDAQMEAWRAHVERIDEEGDEEGFEEL